MEQIIKPIKNCLVDKKVYLTQTAVNVLDIVAKKREISRNSLIRKIINEWIEKNKNEIKIKHS